MESINSMKGIQPTFNSPKATEGKYVAHKEKSVEVKNKKSNEEFEQALKKGVEGVNNFLKNENTEAIISRHKVFGDTMIKIVDKTTKEILLEVPPEKFLDMAAKMCELAGIKLDKKV